MRALLVVGILLIVLGVVSLFVGLPQRHSSGVKIGGAEIGVQTKTSERIPLPASIAIILGGVALAALSGRASH
jgi:ABC-type enterochelin transport system permease subunit